MSKPSPVGAIPYRIVLWLFALLTVVPFGLLLLTSFKSQADLMKGAFALPAYPHFENYVNAWVDGHFSTYFTNSVLVVVPVVATTAHGTRPAARSARMASSRASARIANRSSCATRWMLARPNPASSAALSTEL